MTAEVYWPLLDTIQKCLYVYLEELHCAVFQTSATNNECEKCVFYDGQCQHMQIPQSHLSSRNVELTRHLSFWCTLGEFGTSMAGPFKTHLLIGTAPAISNQPVILAEAISHLSEYMQELPMSRLASDE